MGIHFHTKYHEVRMGQDKELYERQGKIVDVQIDRRVYDLYGLTEEGKDGGRVSVFVNTTRSKL